MITIHDVKQNTPEWHELRSGKVTASNAWKLLTYGKANAIGTSTFKGNYHTERGHTLEPIAIELYAKANLVDVQTVGFVTNDKYPDCGASPDGIAERLIEVKCFGKDKHLSITNRSIPPEIVAQVQFQMMICEFDTCDLVLYNPEVEPQHALRILTIKANKIIQRNIRKALKR